MPPLASPVVDQHQQLLSKDVCRGFKPVDHDIFDCDKENVLKYKSRMFPELIRIGSIIIIALSFSVLHNHLAPSIKS